MNDPTRWLDDDGGATPVEKMLLESCLRLDPPAHAKTAVWCGLGATIAPPAIALLLKSHTASSLSAGASGPALGAASAAVSGATTSKVVGAFSMLGSMGFVKSALVGILVGSGVVAVSRSPMSLHDTPSAMTVQRAMLGKATVKSERTASLGEQEEGAEPATGEDPAAALTPRTLTDPGDTLDDRNRAPAVARAVVNAPEGIVARVGRVAAGRSMAPPSSMLAGGTLPSEGAGAASSAASDGAALVVPASDPTPVPTPIPIPSASAPAASLRAQVVQSTIVEEASRLQAAKEALRKGDALSALALLERLRAAYPTGGLSQEREALTILALARTSQPEATRARAIEFLTQFPHSPYEQRIRSLLTAEKGR